MKYAAVAVAVAGVAAADSTLSIQWEPIATTTASTTWTTWDPKPSTTWTTWDPKPTTTWTTWDPEPTTTWTTWDPKETTTTSSWSAWDPVSESSSSTWTTWDPKPTTTASWSAWEAVSEKTTTTTTKKSKCSYTTAVPTTYCVPGHKDECWTDYYTTVMTADECTWAPWTATTPVADTTSKCSYVTEIATSKCAPNHKDWCYSYTTTSTMYADECTWAPWSTTKSKPAVATETVTWSTWDPVEETTTVSWEPVDYTTTVKSTVTETSSTWASWTVVTSDVAAAWSSEGWFGGAWPTAKSGECVSNVVSSYGYPIWKPTPEAKTTVTATATSSSTWSAWTGAATGHAEIAPNGKKWSMTYSPYTAAGKCKAQAAIEADIKEIASLGFTSVRVYSTDCSTLEFVGAACKANNLKIILGVFIDKTGVKGAAQQVKDIASWGQWEIVELVVIGNEAVFQGFCSASELAAFIKSCKDTFSAAGYTGPCTTTEPLEQWQQYSSEFCAAVDVVGANLYAYFNADCTAENAGNFIEAEIKILEELCSGKKPYVMECGWPSEGQCNGAACPGPENQKTAILAIEETCGESIVFFSFEDEVWKAPGQFGVEQHWGCSGVFGGSSAAATWAPVTATSTATWEPVSATSTTTSTWAAWTTY